jgi:tetratricopeptide (TPR) repeat protein
MFLRAFTAVLMSALFLVPPAWSQVSPESAEKYNAGQDMFKKRRYQDALVAFEEAVKLDAKNAQGYRGMAKTYLKLRNYPQAVESFQMAVGVKPDYLEAYYELGQLQLTTLREYEKAQSTFQSILEMDPDFQEGKVRDLLKAAYVKQGSNYHRQKNFKKAAAQYENAAQLDPTDATVFYNLGLANRFSRNYTKARNAFSTATDLNSKYAKAHRALGHLYRITKKNSQAIRSYGKAIDSDPGCKDKRNIYAYISLGKVYTTTKQASKAVAILQKAVTVSPKKNKAKVYIALGFAHAQRKHFKSAVSAFTQALKFDGRNAEAQYRLASAHFELKNYQNALNAARKATGSSKFRVPAHVIMGDVYDAWRPDGWKEKAIDNYKKGLKDRRNKKYCEDKIDRIINPMGEEVEGE